MARRGPLAFRPEPARDVRDRRSSVPGGNDPRPVVKVFVVSALGGGRILPPRGPRAYALESSQSASRRSDCRMYPLLVLLYRNRGNLARATWRPTSGEIVACRRSDKPIVVETTIHHASESSDDTSRYLRVSIATEVTTSDSPPRFSSASDRSPSDLIWSTPFSPPSHSATVSIRGRIFLGREPKLATLVETFHPIWFTRTEVRFDPSRACLGISSRPKPQRRSRHQPRLLPAAPKSVGSTSRRRSYSRAPLARLPFCDLN